MALIRFFKELYSGFGLGCGVIDKIMITILLFIGIISLFMIGLISLHLINQVAVKEVAEIRKPVIEKRYAPAHSGTTTTVIGKAVIPMPTHTPERYLLCFQFESKIACGSVPKENYDNVSIDQIFTVSYGVGRIDGHIIIRSIK